MVRTTLATSVQEGGSIGYDGSYTVAAPSGTSAQQLAQDQQAVTKDQENLSADEQAEADASTADNQAIAAAQSGVDAAQSTLSADQATRPRTAPGRGRPRRRAAQDTQKVSQDQTQLTQANQQLASAQDAATATTTRTRPRSSPTRRSCRVIKPPWRWPKPARRTRARPTPRCPSVGDVIKQDQPVYSVSNEPVPLLYGSVAAYRAFYVGMSDGADVGELTHDLIALGYGAGLTQSNHYSSATAAAVERWQSALGLPATGEILLGEVVFEPGPIRVTSVTPSVGSAVGGGGGGSGGGGGGTVLTATSTTPIVTVDLDVSQEYLVKPGDAVSIVLPDGTSTVGGHIETVGNVATCPGGGGTGTGTGASGSSSADQSPCSSGGSGSNSDADGDGHHHLGQHPAGGHLGPGPGERQHHHANAPATSWPCR